MKQILLLAHVAFNFIRCSEDSDENQTTGGNIEKQETPAQQIILYAGVKTPMILDLDMTSRECEKTELRTNNGTLGRDSGCHFYLTPEFPGHLKLSLSLRDSGVWYRNHFTYSVKPLPEPVPVFGNQSITDSVISRAEVKVLPGIHIRTSDEYFEHRYFIMRFRMSLFRRDSLIFRADTMSPFISDEMTDLVKRHLRKGDLVSFDSITVLAPDSSIRITRPLKFLVY